MTRSLATLLPALFVLAGCPFRFANPVEQCPDEGCPDAGDYPPLHSDASLGAVDSGGDIPDDAGVHPPVGDAGEPSFLRTMGRWGSSVETIVAAHPSGSGLLLEGTAERDGETRGLVVQVGPTGDPDWAVELSSTEGKLVEPYCSAQLADGSLQLCGKGWLAGLDPASPALRSPLRVTNLGSASVAPSSAGGALLSGTILDAQGNEADPFGSAIVWMSADGSFGLQRSYSSVRWTVSEWSATELLACSITPPVVAKLSAASGDVLWRRRIGVPVEDSAFELKRCVPSADGGVFIVARDIMAGQYATWLAKSDGDGNLLWQEGLTFQDAVWNSTDLRDMRATPDGGLALLLDPTVWGASRALAVARLDANGAVRWITQHDPNWETLPVGFTATPDGWLIGGSISMNDNYLESKDDILVTRMRFDGWFGAGCGTDSAALYAILPVEYELLDSEILVSDFALQTSPLDSLAVSPVELRDYDNCSQ